jgi:hypothetical protein
MKYVGLSHIEVVVSEGSQGRMEHQNLSEFQKKKKIHREPMSVQLCQVGLRASSKKKVVLTKAMMVRA